MNWFVFAFIAWLTLGMEHGLRQALQIGHLNLAPSFVLVLVVFVSLWAKTLQALWASLLLGACLDMLNLVPTSTGETIAILGPSALGCLVASFTVLNFRVMMFRRKTLTIAFLCAVAGAIAGVVVLAILTTRAFYDDIVLVSASSELWQRLGSALYTGVLALFMGPALQWVGPWMGFRKPQSLGGGHR